MNWEVLQNQYGQWILVLGALLAVGAIGLFILKGSMRKFRDRIEEGGQTPEEMLANFREMHREGAVSDVEFRTIEGKLKKQRLRELKDREENT